jgi:hypothetical protein
VPKACILFLAANPRSLDRLALDEEIRDIEQRLHAAKHRDAFECKTRWAVRPDDLQDALLRVEPTIVHFSGHGSEESGIILHDDDGQAKVVGADALRHLFSVLKGKIRLVVLNACYSAEQAKAIAQEIDFVVGMNRRISDEAARKFAASFYRALGFGRSVKTAFDLGVNAIKLHGAEGDDGVPALLVKSGLNPDETPIVSDTSITEGSETHVSGGGLRISDVQVIPNRASRTRTLDFRVWNSGNTDVLINWVELEVLKVEEMHTLGYMEFSKEYDLDISSLKRTGDRIRCNIAQLIPSRGVDRFGIRVNAPQLGTGVYRFWRLRLSLSTNLGVTEGPTVDLSLPCESEGEYRAAIKARREGELAREAKEQWRSAIPGCLVQYWDRMQQSNIDLSVIRQAIEAAYPDRSARSLVLFEWLGSNNGPWNSAPAYEAVPELLLWEIPTSALVASLSAHPLSRAHIKGAIRYFAGWRFSQYRKTELCEVPNELKQLFVEHSPTMGFTEAQLFTAQWAFRPAEPAVAPTGTPRRIP